MRPAYATAPFGERYPLFREMARDQTAGLGDRYLQRRDGDGVAALDRCGQARDLDGTNGAGRADQPVGDPPAGVGRLRRLEASKLATAPRQEQAEHFAFEVKIAAGLHPEDRQVQCPVPVDRVNNTRGLICTHRQKYLELHRDYHNRTVFDRLTHKADEES